MLGDMESPTNPNQKYFAHQIALVFVCHVTLLLVDACCCVFYGHIVIVCCMDNVILFIMSSSLSVVAHLLSLRFVVSLQQTLASLGPGGEHFRQRIQSEFQNLKRSLEKPDTHTQQYTLPPPLRAWLRALLEDIVQALEALTPSMQHRAQPVAQHLLAVYLS